MILGPPIPYLLLVTFEFLNQKHGFLEIKWKSRPWGTHLVDQNMILISKNMRNELLSNYHKFKKNVRDHDNQFEI